MLQITLYELIQFLYLVLVFLDHLALMTSLLLDNFILIFNFFIVSWRYDGLHFKLRWRKQSWVQFFKPALNKILFFWHLENPWRTWRSLKHQWKDSFRIDPTLNTFKSVNGELLLKLGMFLLILRKTISLGGITYKLSFILIFISNKKTLSFHRTTNLLSFLKDALCEEIFLTLNDSLVNLVLMNSVINVVFFIELVYILVVNSKCTHFSRHFWFNYYIASVILSNKDNKYS